MGLKGPHAYAKMLLVKCGVGDRKKQFHVVHLCEHDFSLMIFFNIVVCIAVYSAVILPYEKTSTFLIAVWLESIFQCLEKLNTNLLCNLDGVLIMGFLVKLINDGCHLG